MLQLRPASSRLAVTIAIERRETHDVAERNPNWARDELLVALELYFRIGVQSAQHPDVEEVSELLNQLPIHSHRPDETFRNPNGVNLKLANFAAIDPSYVGAGMERFGSLDKAIFEEFSNDRTTLNRIVASIRETIASGQAPLQPEPDETDDGVAEGRLLYRRHAQRERDPGIVRKKKTQVLEGAGRLTCEVCGFDFALTYGELGDGFIECHHTVPLAESGTARRTRLSDLALLCANCHRMIHRSKPFMSPGQLAELLAEQALA